MSSSDLLLLFTRFPQPGRVKTRLIPALGPVGAARLHRQLTEHTLRTVRAFVREQQADFLICFTGAREREMQQMFGVEFQYQAQSAGDLGARMSAAFADSLGRNRRRVVLIGSDCPGITPRLLHTAFSHLHQYDLVLGPATDGGYYLIGLKAPCPNLFAGLPWGTSEVLALTLARAGILGLRPILLEPLTDIDRPEDLPLWEAFALAGHD